MLRLASLSKSGDTPPLTVATDTPAAGWKSNSSLPSPSGPAKTESNVGKAHAAFASIHDPPEDFSSFGPSVKLTSSPFFDAVSLSRRKKAKACFVKSLSCVDPQESIWLATDVGPLVGGSSPPPPPEPVPPFGGGVPEPAALPPLLSMPLLWLILLPWPLPDELPT